MKHVEKVFKYNSPMYGEIDEIVLDVAEELKKGFHISQIKQIPFPYKDDNDFESNLIITLTKIGE